MASWTMQTPPLQGRVRLPPEPLDPAEDAERKKRRSYVRRLLDLEAERARLQHAAAIAEDQQSLRAEQARRERFRQCGARPDQDRVPGARETTQL